MKTYLLFFISIFLLINNSFAQVTFGTGKIDVRVDDYGAIRIFTTEGTDTVQQINRVSFLIAGNPNEVMDYWNDVDIEVPTTMEPNPEYGDYETSGTYNNAYSGLPPNILVEQHVYGWADQSFCLIKMILTNQESSEIPTIAGLDIIQYVDETWENDNIFYDATNQLLNQFESHYVGIKTLAEQTLSAQVFVWYSGYSDSDSAYYDWMTNGTFHTDTLVTDPDGGVGILGSESVNLASNDSRTVWMAIAVGTDETDMMANMDAAIQEYQSITSVDFDKNIIPLGYTLEQNYPNPFNPSTEIKFGIPQSSKVTLKVFNLIGEQVALLANEILAAGTYTYHFNASDLPSGIYIYTLQAGDNVLSKKMTFIK